MHLKPALRPSMGPGGPLLPPSKIPYRYLVDGLEDGLVVVLVVVCFAHVVCLSSVHRTENKEQGQLVDELVDRPEDGPVAVWLGLVLSQKCERVSDKPKAAFPPMPPLAATTRPPPAPGQIA